MMDHARIEEILGYTFKDKELLRNALTHPSATKDRQTSYQKLEFLGDSILGFVVAKNLVMTYRDCDEGELTKMRAAIVSRTPLAEEIDRLGLTDYVVVGKGEDRERIISQTKMKSDIFEAIVAAIYIDSGSMDRAENFILKNLSEAFDGVCEDEKDYKSELNEYAAKNLAEVSYRQLSVSGPQHAPEFVYGVSLNGKEIGAGKGSKKTIAQQQAAKVALEYLHSRSSKKR